MGEATQIRVLRGGSFHHNIPDELAANWRYGADPAKFGHGRTFRIATIFSPTWIGGAVGADNWSALGNWDGDAPPVSGIAVTFGALAAGGHATNQNDLAAGTQINGITYGSAATAYSLQGNSILLGGAVTNQSGSDETIGLAMQLVAGGGTFDTGSQNMTLAQSISGSGIPLVKLGAGSLTLAAGNTYTGGTTVSQGTLLVSNAAGSGTGTGIVTVSGATLGGTGFINGPVVLTGNSTLASTGTLTINNTLSVQGPANQLASGTISTTADVTINAGAAISISGTLSGGTATNAGTIALLGGTFDSNTHAMSSTGVISGYGTLRTGGLTNHGRVGVSGGNLDVLGPVGNQSDGIIDVPGGSTATFNGPVSGPGQFSGTGKVAFLGGYSTGNSPAIVAFGGDVTLGGANTLTMNLAENDNSNPAIPRFDELNVAHNVSVGGIMDLVWTPRAGEAASKFGGTYDLITYSGQLDGTFTVQCDFSAYIAGINYAADAGAGLKAVRLTLWPLLDGDANLDGRVTLSDLTALAANFGSASATWRTGDFDLDGKVSWQDYLLAKANYGRTANGGTAPEPATLALLALGVATLRRRQGSRAAA
jgi:autotransporter-associated beta strand protein